MMSPPSSFFHSNLGLSAKQLLSVIVLVSTGFFWFFISSMVLGKIASSFGYYESLAILAINLGATVSATLVGAFFPRGHGNIRFLKTWMVAGTVASIFPFVIDTKNLPAVSFIAFLWGVTLGYGMPASMEYLTEETTVENRGRIGAIVFFAMFASIFTASAILESLTYQILIVALGALRLAGLALFVLLNPVETSKTKKAPSYRSIFQERAFLLYFSAWIMFSLVNYLNAPILNRHFGKDFVASYTTVETIITAIFALLSGVLCDMVGRKVVVISGFVMLGLGYAVLGAFPSSLPGWYFYTVADGVAWGILGVVFFMTLWGDLANRMSSKKYFALGGLPLLFSALMQKLVGPDLAASVSVTAVFSLAAFFLFLAVLPLIYAPETLPEKRIKEIELKGYLEKAKKIKEKYA